MHALFEWLDGHPGAYWAGTAVPTLLLLGLVAARLRRADASPPSRRSDRIFALLLLGFLLAWRWPFFLAAYEFNPDESHLIAGAITLTHDPVFWRSVDGTTSGPLNFYALLPLHWLGLPLDYFTARLTGLLLVWVALLACYRLFRSRVPPQPARLALLPATIFFATTTDWDFVHYSSEHVSLALIALSAYWLLRRPTPGRDDRTALLPGGFIAGLLPWAKLQTAPLAVALLGCKLGAIWFEPDCPRPGKWRKTRDLLLAAATPSLLILAGVGVTGQLEHLFKNYLLQNMAYISESSSLRAALTEWTELAVGGKHFLFYLAGSALVLILSGPVYRRARQQPGGFFRAGAILTLVAVACVLVPRRGYWHYLLLIVVPLTLWSGAAVCELWPALCHRSRYAAGLLVMGCLLPLGLRLTQPEPETFGRLADDWRRPYSVAGIIVRAYAQPGDSLGVWGWRTDVYVESGLPKATRDTPSSFAIRPSPRRDYYRARYLTDLQRSRPSLFIDAVGPGAFVFQKRLESAHETFPALAEYISRNYFLLVDLGVERIYARSDSPTIAPRMLTPAELQSFVARARRDPDRDAPEPETLSPAGLGKWNINGRTVQMMLPPAVATWGLDGTEREVLLEYGFHPRAYKEGHSNGAVFIVELQTGGYPPRLLFQRYLNPARQRTDRGTQTTRLTLPPFAPDTRFVVRTDPGESGDNAWDWVYLARVHHRRATAYSAQQFPGFNRVPDRADANYSLLINNDREHQLLLHAPGALTYILRGTEHHLRFAYGFQPGAYTNGGQTDGATYRIELHHAGQPVRILFARSLHPLETAADRGRQQTALALTDIQPGDQLVLRIDPGASNSWDWTYVTDFELR